VGSTTIIDASTTPNLTCFTQHSLVNSSCCPVCRDYRAAHAKTLWACCWDSALVLDLVDFPGMIDSAHEMCSSSVATRLSGSLLTDATMLQGERTSTTVVEMRTGVSPEENAASAAAFSSGASRPCSSPIFASPSCPSAVQHDDHAH